MIQQDIKQLLQPSIENMGYELWGVEYLAQKKHALLRIYIDSPKGINIEDCEKVSLQVSAILDVEDPISQNFRLEISSPGIPRPLFYSEQYQRYYHHEVQIKLFRPIDGKRNVVGKIIFSDHEKVRLACDDKEQEFLFSNIVKANLTVE